MITASTVFQVDFNPLPPIGDVFDKICTMFPAKLAIATESGQITYENLYQQVETTALKLLDLEILPEQKIALWAKNRIEYIVFWFACCKIGAIMVPLDYWYRPQDAQFIINNAGIRTIVCAGEYFPMIAALQNCPSIDHVITLDDPISPYPTDFQFRLHSYSEWITNSHQIHNKINLTKLQERQNSIQPEDTMIMFYTSGTTGSPKGAMLSHRNILLNMKEMAECLRCTEDDIHFVPLPLSHVFGANCGIIIPLITGGSMVTTSSPSTEVALQLLADYRCTLAYATPTHFFRYITGIEAAPKNICLKRAVVGGAPSSPTLIQKMRDVLHILPLNGYGLSEHSPVVSVSRFEDSDELRSTTIGKPLPSVEAKIVDQDNRELPHGTFGELAVRSPFIMKGYYNEPQATAKAIDKDGFLHTGDLVSMDANGYLTITGRIKDMIIYGGFNVYPSMVENYLLAHPKITNAIIVGVPDEEYGELVACIADIKEGLTGQEIVDYCYGQIADPCVPRYVIFDIPIPLSGRGKIQKFKVREELIRRKSTGTLGPRVIPTQIQKKKGMKLTKTNESIAEKLSN
jgi:fatty-acyl-CoA synthase